LLQYDKRPTPVPVVAIALDSCYFDIKQHLTTVVESMGHDVHYLASLWPHLVTETLQLTQTLDLNNLKLSSKILYPAIFVHSNLKHVTTEQTYKCYEAYQSKHKQIEFVEADASPSVLGFLI
jgi:hypothetical protein